MIPVPVRILNNENQYGQALYKRFFIFDALSSKPSLDQEAAYIRFAKSIKVYYELLPRESNAEIYPPILLIDYDFVATNSDLKTEISMEFVSEYRMDYKIQSRNLWISIGLFMLMGLIWSFVRTWNWNRRSGKYACDMIGLFKFFTFFSASVGERIMP